MTAAQATALRERLLDLLSQDTPLAGLTPPRQRTLHELLDQAVTSTYRANRPVTPG
jgi:hypothetical protein